MADTVNDFIRFGQAVEGNRIADLQWGTANAKQIIVTGRVCIGDQNPVDQHPCLSVMNGAKNRSFVAEIAEGPEEGSFTDIYPFSVVIPGDTAGVWANDNTVGMYLFVSLYAGTSMQTATLNAWQAGAFYGSNRMSTAGLPLYYNNFIATMGLYADPYKTGIAPEFEVPLYEDDLADCQRYWYRMYGGRGVVTATTTIATAAANHPVPTRTTPAGSVVGTIRVYDGTAAPNMSAVSAGGNGTIQAAPTVTASGLIVGRPGMVLVDGQTANYVAMNARM